MFARYGPESGDGFWNSAAFDQHYEPVILDASIFTSIEHCEAILVTRKTFHVSQTLYRMLYQEDLFETITFMNRYFSYFPRKPFEYYPRVLAERLMAMKDILKPYRYKEHIVKELLPYLEKIRQPKPKLVRDIVLDEYSFLREHSSVLMRTKRFANYLHKWGVIILDATNRIYRKKHELLAATRGVRWILGIILALKGNRIIPLSQEYTMLGGLILLLLDP